MTQQVSMGVEIDDSDAMGARVHAVMAALDPICRDPMNPGTIDGGAAVDVLGACAALIFAGIPESLRQSQIDPWVEFVRSASMNIQTDKMHALKVRPRSS